MMNNHKSAKIAESEKSTSFRRERMPFAKKWRSPLYIAPVILLLMSVFALLYLLNNNLLLSWYALPYGLLFVLATVWFKTARRTVVKRFVDEPEALLTASAVPVLADKHKVYVLFSTASMRHNVWLTQKVVSDAGNSYADLIPKLKKGQSLPIATAEAEGLRVGCLRAFAVRRANPKWNEKEPFGVVYVDGRVEVL